MSHLEFPDDEPDVIKVDFTRRKVVSRPDPPSVGYEVGQEREAIAGLIPEAKQDLHCLDTARLIRDFTTFIKRLRGFVRGQANQDALRYNKDLTIDELKSRLRTGQDQWMIHPQYYDALCHLLVRKIRAQAGL